MRNDLFDEVKQLAEEVMCEIEEIIESDDVVVEYLDSLTNLLGLLLGYIERNK